MQCSRSADDSELKINLTNNSLHKSVQHVSVSADTGKIHKVLEAGSKPFIISETQISSQSSVQSMTLDSKKVEKILQVLRLFGK